MRKLDVVLIHIYYPESGYGEKLNFPPLGLGYISEYLTEKDIDHLVIDMGLGYSQSYIIEKLREINPKWIGISLNSLLINKTRDFIENIKNALKNSKIVVGGPHVTTQEVKIFSDLPCIDYSIVAEGEKSFYELIINKNLPEIKGLIYKDKDGNIISNERRITKNLDKLPFPRFQKFELNKYAQKIGPVITSRGCPFKCIFCQQSSLLSKVWRGVSAKNVIANLKYWQELGYKEIHVMDDNFAFDIKRLKEIVDLFEKEDFGDLKLVFIPGIRVSKDAKEILMLLKRINIDYISFGVETFSDQTLKFIKKGTTVSLIESTVRDAIELSFKVRLFFIIGFPYQTVDSIRNFFKFILKYPIYQVRFFNLIPYENTQLKEWIDKHGRFLFQSNEYMNYFKKFQDIPVFEAEHTLPAEIRTRELKFARYITQIIEERSKFLFDEIDEEGRNLNEFKR